MTFSSLAKFSQIEKRVLVFGVLISIFTKGIALFSLGFSVDDLWYWQVPFNFDTAGALALRDGRFTFPFISMVADAFGVNLPRSPTLSGIFLILCQVYCGLLLCRLWRVTNISVLSTVIVSVIAVTPYLTDIFTWKMSMFTGGIPFAVSLIALVISRDEWSKVPFAVAMIVVALGIHQIPIQWLAVALIFSAVLAVVDWLEDRDLGLSIHEVVRMLVAVAVLTIIYWTTAMAISHLYGNLPTLRRERIILFTDPGLVWARVVEIASLFAFKDPLTSTGLRWLFLFLTIVASIVALGIRRGWPARALFALVGFLGAIGLSFFASIILTVAPEAWIPVFRNVSAVSVIWAGVIALAYRVSQGDGRRLVIGISALVVFGFAGKSNEILTDQLRANERDRVLVAELAVRISQLPNLENISHLAFVGTTVAPLRNLATGADLSSGWRSYGTTLSAFAVPWDGYLVQLFNEATGSNYLYSSPEDRKRIGDQICDTSSLFPSPAALHTVGTTAVICLGRPTPEQPGPFDYVESQVGQTK